MNKDAAMTAVAVRAAAMVEEKLVVADAAMDAAMSMSKTNRFQTREESASSAAGDVYLALEAESWSRMRQTWAAEKGADAILRAAGFSTRKR